jgi:hypothetical protein
LFTEAAGNTTRAYNSSISTVQYGGYVHTQIRRFIVVRTKKGTYTLNQYQEQSLTFSSPIFTYGKQATKKPGINAQEHAVAYSEGQYPKLLPGEEKLAKEPICVAMTPAERNSPLSELSRIRFGIHHPIQHNVKVKLIGKVIEKDMPNLRGYWNMENIGFASSPADAMADAWDESSTDQSEPHLYDATRKLYGYDTQFDLHMYHPKHNLSGYHPTSNIHGFHPQSNPHMYHPTHNFHGYHEVENPAGHHPSVNEHGYHPTHNPYGFHAELAPFCYHPHSNPQGYHAHYNPQGYHPHSNKYGYHERNNPFGYNSHDNAFGYHDQHNPYGYHPVYNVRGYHPQTKPNAYHPFHHPEITSQEERDDDSDDSDDETEDSDNEGDCPVLA